MMMHMMRGGAQMYSPAGVSDASMMSSSRMNLAQGSDYQRLHEGQHGGAMVSLASSAPVGYTGMLDQDLRATAHLGPLDASLNAVRGMSDQSGGSRRKGSKSITRRAVAAIKKLKNMFKKIAKMGRMMMSRKKMRGGKMYGGQMNMTPKMMGGSKMYGGQMNMAHKMMGGSKMYGGQMNMTPKMMGGAKTSKSMTRRAVAAIKKLKNMFKKMVKKGRSMMSRKKMRGGAASSLAHAADYSSPGMLLSPAMENRALLGMHTQEWKLAEDPMSFAPKMA